MYFVGILCEWFIILISELYQAFCSMKIAISRKSYFIVALLKKSLSLYVKHMFVKIYIFMGKHTNIAGSNALRRILIDIDLAGLEYLIVIRLMLTPRHDVT